MQRVLDVLFASIALVILSPLLVLTVVLLRLTGEGEILFLQTRIGKDRKTFELYKFATMIKDSPNIGPGTVTIKNDTRVLPLGKFLRKTKINELPQLINILLGDMSLVGPRPQAKKNFEFFPLYLQDLIVSVKPGLSGLGSIVFRGEEALLAEHASSIEFYSNVIAPYKGQLEAWYVVNNSLATYFLIIFATIWIIFFPNSRVAWRVFTDLPTPPEPLIVKLKFSY